MTINTVPVPRKLYTGTATVEFAIALAFFVPVFITVPIIGKYQSFKQKNIESSRYAVWERTVWSDPGGRWNDNENTKTDFAISNEVDRRFYGSQIQGMASKSITDNKLWVDRKSKKMLTAPAKGKTRVSVKSGAGVSPIKNTVVDALAYKGIPVVGGALKAITKIANASLGKVISDCKDLPGIDLEKGMNLGSRTYSTITVSSPMKNLMPFSGKDGKKPKDLIFTAGGAILSNAWTAPTESKYQERVGKLVIDETVRCIALPSRIISIIPFYVEGKAASDVASAAKTTVLLKEYKK